MDTDDEDAEQGHSEISCGPNCMVPKLLVSVVRAELDAAKKTTQYVIHLSLLNSQLEWTVKRRFSEFLKIRHDVYYAFLGMNVNQCFGCRWFSQSLCDFEFPRKHLVNSKGRMVIRHRRTKLDRFCRLMAAHTFSAIPKCVRCSVEPFNTIREFFTANALMPPHVTASQIREALVPGRFAAISDPRKSKIEFRRGHGVFKVLQVEKPIHLQWSEYDAAMRNERIRRRRHYSSCTSDARSSADDTVDLDEEKPPSHRPSSSSESSDTVEVLTPSVSLQPPQKAPENKEESFERPRADARADTLPWNLRSPRHTAAKEA